MNQTLLDSIERMPLHFFSEVGKLSEKNPKILSRT